MEWALIGAILLLFLGLALVVLEVFVPNGGIIATLAGVSLVVSVILGFMHSTGAGVSLIVTIIVALPICIAVALHYWPNTPMGRRILLKVPTRDEVMPDDPDRRRLKQLVGQVGRAKSKMLPSGAVEIGGRTIDALSEGMAIDPGQMVRVIEVRGTRVVVRPVDEEAPATAEGDLARPIDTVGLNPFEDPLA